MKRSLLSAILMCAFSCLMAGQALAGDVCPENTTLFTDSTGQLFCIPNEAAASQAAIAHTINYYNEKEVDYQKSKLLHRSMMEPGFSIEGGMGYSMAAAALFQVNLEYQFDASDNETMSFGINTKVNLRVGSYPPFGVDWAIGPAMHFNWGIFRTTVTLGFGIFWEKPSKDYYSYNNSYDEETVYTDAISFQIKPEIKFDFVLTEGLWIGFGLDPSLIFIRENQNGSNEEKKYEFEGVLPWVNLDLHVGYKF